MASIAAKDPQGVADSPSQKVATFRLRLILRRWISLASCGFLAAIAIYLTWPVIGAPLEPLRESLESIPSPIVESLLVLGFLVVVFNCGRGRWLALLGLRHFVTYPPLWVAVVIGCAVLVQLNALAHRPGSMIDLRLLNEPIAALAVQYRAYLALLLVVTLVAGVVSLRVKKHAGRDQVGNALSTFESLRVWLAGDREIDHPDQDLFEHRTVAKRICERLTQPQSPTMAIVGSYGSGKSTIRRLTRHYLQPQHDVEIVEVGLWPFETPEAAVAGILNELVQSLGLRVNVLAIRGLPAQYVRVVKEATGRWGTILNLLQEAPSPKDILQRLGAVAQAIDVRFVLWIEDMERFSDAAAGDEAGSHASESSRLNPIRSLLYELDQHPQISVLVSDISLGARFDLDKIARFVENPPRPKPDQVAKVVELLRTNCLRDYPRAIITSTTEKRRVQFEIPGRPGEVFNWLDALDSSSMTIMKAFVTLAETPRALKNALRQTLDSWERLAGEIDFDDALLASLLRVARPSLFAFIDDHIELFRNGFRDPLETNTTPKDPTKHPVYAQFEKLLQSELTDRHRSAIERIVVQVFPAALAKHAANDRDYIDKPQGLANARHADYWRRYNAGTIDESESGDQDALQAIASWKKIRTSDLIERLTDPVRSDQIESFVGQFAGNDLLRLLNEAVEAVKHLELHGDTDTREYFPGIVAIWRMCLARRPEEEKTADLLCDLMRRVVPVNLPLAQDLKYYFSEPDGSVPRLVRSELGERIEQSLHDSLCKSFLPDRFDEFEAAMKGGTPYVVFHVAWGLRRIRAENLSGLPFSRWPEFAEMLLALTRRGSRLGTGIVATFVTDGVRRLTDIDEPSGSPRRVYVAEFNDRSARRLFGLDKLADAVRAFEIPSEVRDEMDERVRALLSWAREYLSESKGANEVHRPDDPDT